MPLRVAVLGCWHVHAKDYARAAVRHPDTQPVLVWDEDPERGRPLAQELGVDVTDDLEAVLTRSDVDAVTVTTATSDHRAVLLAAAAAGKHIFTEKLLAPTVVEAEEIIAAADGAGVALVVSLPRLDHGSTRAVTELLAAGKLGRPTYARVRLSHDGAVAGWLPERFFDPGPAVGGALTDLGCHPAYLTQLFLGTHPQTVTATYRSVTGRRVEDHAVVCLGYGDQSIGVVEAGFVSANPFSIEVYGTDGALHYTEATGVLNASGSAFGGPGWQPVALPDDGPDPFSQWVAHARNGTRAEDNLVRAVELTRLVVAANAAAADGTTVAYPQPGED